MFDFGSIFSPSAGEISLGWVHSLKLFDRGRVDMGCGLKNAPCHHIGMTSQCTVYCSMQVPIAVCPLSSRLVCVCTSQAKCLHTKALWSVALGFFWEWPVGGNYLLLTIQAKELLCLSDSWQSIRCSSQSIFRWKSWLKKLMRIIHALFDFSLVWISSLILSSGIQISFWLMQVLWVIGWCFLYNSLRGKTSVFTGWRYFTILNDVDCRFLEAILLHLPQWRLLDLFWHYWW